MKKVINADPVGVVSVNKVDVEKFYGVEPNPSARGFIHRRECGQGLFTILHSREFTDGNGWTNWDDENLESMILHLLHDGKPVYEFDTFEELMFWVVKRL